jgi:hypothetical protein
MVDQRIEERESLRHSTHRSQRSDRMQGAHTATDRFNATDGGGGLMMMGEQQERPNFQGTGHHHIAHSQHQKHRDDHGEGEGAEIYTEMPH